jgi:hypothetical protein
MSELIESSSDQDYYAEYSFVVRECMVRDIFVSRTEENINGIARAEAKQAK